MPRPGNPANLLGIFNPLDYGAAGDGVTDDALALFIAVDQASRVPGGGTVLIDAPLLVRSRSIVVPNTVGCWYVGVGAVTTAGGGGWSGNIANIAGGSQLGNGGGLVAVAGDGSVSVTPAANKTVKQGGMPGVYRPQWYGCAFDGVTDDTAAWNRLFAALYAAGGGTIELPATLAPSLILGQLLLPNDGGGVPKQPAIKIVGPGAYTMATTGESGAALGAGMLDLRYSGAGAKIVTLGAGQLEIEGVTFVNLGTDQTTPFLLATNTVVKVHHCAFYGYRGNSGIACQQDAIILGGTDAAVGGLVSSPFQGYGSAISNNDFHNIRCAVFGKAYANGVPIFANTIWNSCGSNDATIGAFTLQGIAANSCAQDVILANLIEASHYPYVCVMSKAINCGFVWNTIFDCTATTLGIVYFAADANFNKVAALGATGTGPAVQVGGYVHDVGASPTTNSIDNPGQSQVSLLAQPQEFTNSHVSTWGTASPTGEALQDVSGNWFLPQMLPSAQPRLLWYYQPFSTHANQGTIGTRVVNATDILFELWGTAHNTIQAPNGTQIAIGSGSPATTATSQFPAIPVMAGAPTGVPVSSAGFVPMAFDSTNNKLWVYTGGAWKGVVVA